MPSAQPDFRAPLFALLPRWNRGSVPLCTRRIGPYLLWTAWHTAKAPMQFENINSRRCTHASDHCSEIRSPAQDECCSQCNAEWWCAASVFYSGTCWYLLQRTRLQKAEKQRATSGTFVIMQICVCVGPCIKWHVRVL